MSSDRCPITVSARIKLHGHTIDNLVFQCHYRITSGILLVFTIATLAIIVFGTVHLVSTY